MTVERQYLSGSYISQSPDISAIDPSDIFLISEPFVDKKECDQFFSRKMTYETLSSQLIADVVRGLHLDSMSWELSDDYARYGHIHDYSKVQVSSIYSTKDNGIPIVDVVTNGTYNRICMRYVKIPVQDKPDIGQLMFKSKLGEKPLNSDDFDGWVHPDGRYLDKTRFTSAYEVFGTRYGESEDGKQFAIPKLEHFIKANPCLVTSGMENHVRYRNGVGVHSHSIGKLNTQKKINSTLSVSVSSGNQKGVYSHAGNYRKGLRGEVTSTLQFRIEEHQITNFSSEPNEKDIESHPKYNVIPVLMYIGGEK